MTLDEIKKYFGTGYNFQKKTKMCHTCWLRWDRRGFVPLETQRKLEKLTDGYLIARFEDGRPNEE